MDEYKNIYILDINFGQYRIELNDNDNLEEILNAYNMPHYYEIRPIFRKMVEKNE